MKKPNSILAITISVTMLAASIYGCGDDSPDKLIASSKEFLAKNDAKAAAIQLKNALQQNPNIAEARFLLGKALLESGDPIGAGVELRKAYELKFSPEQTIPLLAEALLATGQAKKVTEEFAKTELPAGEPLASLQSILSAAYEAQGNKEAAQTALAASLATMPDYVPAQLADARSKLRDRKLDEAQRVVDAVLSKNPKNANALFLNANLQRIKGQPEAAIAQYRKAIEVRPDLIAAHSAIITIYFQQQKLDDATNQLELLKKVSPKHPQTLFLEAQSRYLRKDYKSARNLIQEVLKQFPDNPNSLQLAGAVEFQLRSYAQAETNLSKALQLAPDLILARKLLISSYIRAGQPTKALNTLQPVLDKMEGDSSLLSLAGETYLQNGDATKAAEYFGKSSKLDPSDANKKTTLALAHLAQGNSVGALDELEQISQNDKGTTADMALIAAHLRANQIDKALKAIDNLERKQPDNPTTYNLRARTLLVKKDLPGARRNFEKALSINPTFFPAAASLASLDVVEKKLNDASKRFEGVLAADPKNTQAILALAELKATNGGTADEVSSLINKAITANPVELAPRLALIQYYLNIKDSKKATAAANDAIAALPDQPEILDALGRTQQVSGDKNQALITYGKLAGLQASSPLPHMRLAEIHLASNNKLEASKNLRKALEIKPDLVEAQRALILLEMDAKRPGEALTLARQVEKQRPTESIGFILEGDIHATGKSWPDAINTYRKGLKQVSAPELAIKLHSALIVTNNSSEAEKVAASWLKEHPKDIAFRLYQGDIATARQEYAQAAQHYRGALDAQPENPLVLNNLAWVSAQLKAPQALEYAEKANQLAPNQPPFMDTLAMLLAEKGDVTKAIELLRKAMAIAPEATAIQLNLSKILLRAGKREEARKELDAIAKLGEKFPGQAEVTRLIKEL